MNAITLCIAQQAIQLLAQWAGLDFSNEICLGRTDAIERAKQLLGWTGGAMPNGLTLLFDQVRLSNKQLQLDHHYWIPAEIADEDPSVPYPVQEAPTTEQMAQFKRSVRQALETLNAQDWENLPLLMLILEKFGCFISLGEPDVALTDLVRSTAAVAAALAEDPQAAQLSLIAGDLSGIQDFIYTISSDGALKSLRARSFYLELVTEEIVQQLLSQLNLPRTNVIYAGGGNLYVLAAATEQTRQVVEQVQQDFNDWFLREFQGKVFLALSHHEFPTKDVGSAQLSIHWKMVIEKQNQQKLRKFDRQLDRLLQVRESYETCQVCHRDDMEPNSLKSLNQRELDSPRACPQCRQMFQLGGDLPRAEVIVRAVAKPLDRQYIPINLNSGTVYYHLLNLEEAERIELGAAQHTVLLINSWRLEDYRTYRATPLLLGNYGQRGADQSQFISAAEMAGMAQGIDRVGYLRMDVDRLGQIFANGLGDAQTLPRLSGLSRQMSYFFKVYLNSLAAQREQNLLSSPPCRSLSQAPRLDLLFIYAGGDDLFVSGAWNQILEFGFDVYQAFRNYTGNHPEITLSGGITIAGEKYPLYQAANTAGEAESQAKANGKDSLGALGEVFKWAEWLGDFTAERLNLPDQDYLSLEPQPELFGVLPFVQALDRQLDVTQSRAFVRNLLLTAQLQTELIKQAKEKRSDQTQAIRYYLHLPKVAYTLARLPPKVRDHRDFAAVSTSLKNPRNAPYFRAIATWLELLNRRDS